MINERPKRKHEESDLHLKFCKWVKKTYPNDLFIRHEREQQRSKFMQGLMKVYNCDIDMPDFECLESATTINWEYFGLYIEFKKPGAILTLKDGITIKKEYSNQYRAHMQLWGRNRPAYFATNLEDAHDIYNRYKSGDPLPMQEFKLPVDEAEEKANNFFTSFNL